jgi:hypothetical protein
MGLIHAFVGEEGLVGRDQRKVVLIGQIDQTRLDALLDLEPMALELDIELARKGRGQSQQQSLGFRGVPFRQAAPDAAMNAARQRDQVRRPALDIVQRDLGRFRRLGLHEGLGDQLQQIEIAGLVLGQQHQLVGLGHLFDAAEAAVLLDLAPDGDLHADDRLDAGVGAGGGEFQRAEQIAGVGHGLTGLDQLLDTDGAFGERIGGVKTEMDEIGVRHNASLIERTVGTSAFTRTGAAGEPAVTGCKSDQAFVTVCCPAPDILANDTGLITPSRHLPSGRSAQ